MYKRQIPIRIELGKLIRKVFLPEDGDLFVDSDYSLSLIHIFGRNAANMELLCRGMTFYGSVITSAVIILIGYIIRKKVAK